MVTTKLMLLESSSILLGFKPIIKGAQFNQQFTKSHATLIRYTKAASINLSSWSLMRQKLEDERRDGRLQQKTSLLDCLFKMVNASKKRRI